MFVLDTSVVINLLRNKDAKETETVLNTIRDDPYFLTAFSVYELLRGAKPNEISTLRSFLDQAFLLSFDRTLAEYSAALEHSLVLSGKTFTPLDLFIAATCQFIGGTLLTLDKQFADIPGLSAKIISSKHKK